MTRATVLQHTLSALAAVALASAPQASAGALIFEAPAEPVVIYSPPKPTTAKPKCLTT